MPRVLYSMKVEWPGANMPPLHQESDAQRTKPSHPYSNRRYNHTSYFSTRYTIENYHHTIQAKMMGKATRGRKRMELLHDMMEGRDYGQLKDLISDRSRWRQDSN